MHVNYHIDMLDVDSCIPNCTNPMPYLHDDISAMTLSDGLRDVPNEIRVLFEHAPLKFCVMDAIAWAREHGIDEDVVLSRESPLLRQEMLSIDPVEMSAIFNVINHN